MAALQLWYGSSPGSKTSERMNRTGHVCICNMVFHMMRNSNAVPAGPERLLRLLASAPTCADHRTMAVADVADSGMHGRAGDVAAQRLARRLEADAVPAADDDAVAGGQVLARQREAEPPAAARDHDAQTVGALRCSAGRSTPAGQTAGLGTQGTEHARHPSHIEDCLAA